MSKAIEALKIDYQVTFGSPAGQRVLDNLAKVCFITTVEGAYAGDTNETMFRLGCQEVFRIICLHLGLTAEQLAAIYVPGRKTKIGETDG